MFVVVALVHCHAKYDPVEPTAPSVPTAIRLVLDPMHGQVTLRLATVQRLHRSEAAPRDPVMLQRVQNRFVRGDAEYGSHLHATQSLHHIELMQPRLHRGSPRLIAEN